MSAANNHEYLAARDFEFCPWCGRRLGNRTIDGRTRSACSECGYIWYKNPIPAAGGIIHNNGDLLLVKRKYDPQKGLWCLPAGFQEYDESPVDCCRREIKEETGLDVEIERLFWNYKAGDDPRAMVVLFLYLVKVVGGKLEPGDDAIEVEYFPLDSIPREIAFSAHVRAISHFREFLNSGKLPSGE